MSGEQKEARAAQRWMSVIAVMCSITYLLSNNDAHVIVASVMLAGCGVIDAIRAFHPDTPTQLNEGGR